MNVVTCVKLLILRDKQNANIYSVQLVFIFLLIKDILLEHLFFKELEKYSCNSQCNTFIQPRKILKQCLRNVEKFIQFSRAECLHYRCYVFVSGGICEL